MCCSYFCIEKAACHRQAEWVGLKNNILIHDENEVWLGEARSCSSSWQAISTLLDMAFAEIKLSGTLVLTHWRKGGAFTCRISLKERVLSWSGRFSISTGHSCVEWHSPISLITISAKAYSFIVAASIAKAGISQLSSTPTGERNN